MAPDAREPMGQPTAADTNTATDKNAARTSDENRNEGDTADALASVLRALAALMNAGSPKAMVGRLGAARLADVALLQGGLAYLTDVLEALRTMQGEMRHGSARPSAGAGAGAGADTERQDSRKRGVVSRVIRYGGYAFVKPQGSDEQPDVFVHLSSLQGGFAWDDLQEGMTVLYRDRTDRQGRRAATAVWPLKADMPLVTH